MPPPRPRGLPPRSLAEVATRLGVPAPQLPAAVTGVTLDSREVLPGDLYAALPGQHAHGASFAPEAVERGAVAVLCDQPLNVAVPVLVVEDPRARLGALASWVYGEPSRRLSLLGVTGTNGKTTTAYLMEAGLRGAGAVTGLLGTVETHLAGEVLPADRTTPEAPELQALLAVMVERGVTAASMEVSSHALAQGRVDGCSFTVGVFTNLSQDHLDYHGDLEHYFAAKAALFRPGCVDSAVVNVDDPWGRRLLELLRVPSVTVSTEGLPHADWQLAELRVDLAGSHFRALGPAGEEVAVWVSLPGAFNAANALAALAALVASGVDAGAAARGLASLTRVPGRLERVEAGQPFTAVVDYAHTPQAVAVLLATLRPLTRGRLTVVLGCGGDRDRTKRAAMARAAAAAADRVVFTSDNPRFEDPLEILADMTRDLPAGGWSVQPDRAAAVRAAVADLGAEDTLVVAGKGHETGQEIAGTVLPMDDRELVRAAVAAAGYGSA
ncbi:MAG: UDP-N-acetylmuramoyl-L-alanyl-D-glutamate--2,6-diaminopimelate ligase [Mycobacteriales bacterium]